MDKKLYNTLNKVQLIEKLDSEEFVRLTCSFYKYINIKDPSKLRDEL